MRYLAAAFDIALWFRRASSEMDIADSPSRGRILSFPKPEPVRFELPAAQYWAGYIANILQNVRAVWIFYRHLVTKAMYRLHSTADDLVELFRFLPAWRMMNA